MGSIKSFVKAQPKDETKAESKEANEIRQSLMTWQKGFL